MLRPWSRQEAKGKMVETIIGRRSYGLLEQGLYWWQRVAPTCPFSFPECSQIKPNIRQNQPLTNYILYLFVYCIITLNTFDIVG